MDKKNLSTKETFTLAFQNHQKNNLEAAENLYKEILKKNPNHFQSNFLLGTLSAQTKKFDIAKRLLRKAVIIQPDNADAHNNLGNVQRELGEHHKAKNSYQKAIQIYPNHVDAHNNLGTVLKELCEPQKAIICHEKAIQINPNHAGAHYNLGIVFNELGEHHKTIICYEKAIQINPNHAGAHYNLGIIFNESGELKKAISCFQKATQINPNYADAHNNLGITFNSAGELQKAIISYQKAIQINPDYADAHNNLGITFKQSGEHQKSISCYEKAIQINPNHADAHNNLGTAFNELGELKKAISFYEKAIQIEPNNLTSHWLSMNTFPIIYENLKEIDFYRRRFEDGIKKINKLLDTQSQYTKKQMLDAMRSSTNFYLSYQGRNDINLQKKYANLVERLTEKIYPQFYQERKVNKSREFIKIGFISAFFRNHSISKAYKNWILKLDQNLFKIFVYYVGNEFDETTSKIKKSSNNFFNNTNIDQLINRISEDRLDILVYLDIGMHPNVQILASLRLAPIQSNTWGHPVTSGLKNIDYFFSSELMEKKESQKYYSEELINLPGIGTDYNNPDLSNIKKTNTIKKTDKIIFLNFQSLFKLLPQDDHVFLDIQQKEPNCQFWFFEAKNELITSIFKSRVSKLSKDYGVSFSKYFYFHPRCKYNEFLGVIEASDIILDCLNFSGFNTAMEAISLNKPIVTLSGLFIKTRLAYSILKKISIEETIASTKEEYIQIAIKLAKDNDFRHLIINKIVKNKNKLFNDDKPIRFFEEVIRKKLLQLTKHPKPEVKSK